VNGTIWLIIVFCCCSGEQFGLSDSDVVVVPVGGGIKTPFFSIVIKDIAVAVLFGLPPKNGPKIEELVLNNISPEI
jgi:hypothetical protein